MSALQRMSPCLLLLCLACDAGQPAASEARFDPVAAAPAFVQPPGTVAVDFSVDDSANRVYGPGDLRWKGSFLFDETTRTLTLDTSWTGGPDGVSGWPLLYDDGPWTDGGHEPAGAVAGDSRWGVTAFVAPPASGTDVYEYGLIDTSMSNGWIWLGNNGSFSVPAGATDPITAPGMTFAKFGTSDLALVLDTGKLWKGYAWNTATLTVKGSAWGWSEVPLTSIGHGRYLFVLSSVVGAGHQFPHAGLLHPGDVVQFVFVLGGEEYKLWYFDEQYQYWYSVVPDDGVTAAVLSPCPPFFRVVPITNVGSDGNTAVEIPAMHCRPNHPR